MGKVAYRNRGGRWVEIEQVTATNAKNRFGAVLEEAAKYGAVAITRNDSTKAILLSVEEFESLVDRNADPLKELESSFDAWLDNQQTPKARKALKRAFRATSDELGRSAVHAAARTVRKPRHRSDRAMR